MKLLLISNSTNYKEPYLEWCTPLIIDFLRSTSKNILFIPYAGIKVGGTDYPHSYDAYLEKVKNIFNFYGYNTNSIHHYSNPIKAVDNAEIIMIGGGNTFNLVAEIHRNRLIDAVRRRVMEGAFFLGWSAGSNVACPSLRTTNDMPVVMPESFKTFDFVPFQINPHYIDPYTPDINDAIRHGGETRQDRIEEFLALNPEITVAGLREGTALLVEDGVITLKGSRSLRIMRYGQQAFEIEPERKFTFSFDLITL